MLELRLLSVIHGLQREKIPMPSDGVVKFQPGDIGERIWLLGNGVCMWFFTEYAHLHYLCSKMVSGLFVFLWNCAAKKWVLFYRYTRRISGVQRRDTPNCPSALREDVHGAVAQREWDCLPGQALPWAMDLEAAYAVCSRY
jgi:hypothetical protein